MRTAEEMAEQFAVHMNARLGKPLKEEELKDLQYLVANYLKSDRADAVAEEREACAALALEVFEEGAFYENVKSGGSQIADAIRARGRPS